MPRQSGTVVENQFVLGLRTEATGFNFPEKACIEAWNTRFDKSGRVSRRLGYDNESVTLNTAINTLAGARRSYVWKNPGNSNRTFVVVQNGNVIRFFRVAADGTFIGGLHATSINLNSYDIGKSLAEIQQYPCSFASAKGYLFLCHPLCDPIYVDYTASSNSFTVTQYELQVRDMEGVDDGLDPDERPTTLSKKHKYNLYNQGWGHPAGTIAVNGSGDPQILDAYVNAWSEYPSNGEQWWNYKTTDDQFSPSRRYGFPPVSSAAPRGHYIYNAFDIDRSSQLGVSGVPGYSRDSRPSATTFYAGRVWYAGVDDKVYYTQIIENDKQFGLCYQKNDPTDENFSDLLDTDGGVIQILGLGKSTGLFTAGTYLYIFSNNGIWVVTGSGAEGTGFVATDFAVRRISSVPLMAIDSLIDVEGAPIWWNLEGIWAIQSNQAGSPEIVPMSHETIKSFLDTDCPIANRPTVQGAYNPNERTIQWIYRSTEADDTTETYQYDRVLEFNMVTGSFQPMKWEGDRFLSTIVGISNILVETMTVENVTDSLGATVTDSLGAPVTTTELTSLDFTSSKFKYVILTNEKINVLEESNTAYVDFAILGDDEDYESYFISGAKVHGEGRTKNLEYITVFAKTDENNSAYLRTQWDWANAESTAKWSNEQQVYSVNRGNRDVSRKRLLIRGSGPALQLKFTSESGKPFHIIGWSCLETVDAHP